ncbi:MULTISPECIES: MCE family protein [unclassified Rhodococcus (in: high G+C Gram-positive bacteria)]|uniref:MCE family protein n=1 Tax=unclassified Rhodococcus (in: high G+C Gram-positive bacteria) TaxID=192944 RepID=UPI0020787832|nr:MULTISPECIES: MCE family protein [unclassified Rhodococcus (in: high G+C Gram-positive bacteria)]
MARALPARLLAVVIAVAIVGLLTAAWIENHSVNHVTAYFRNTTGMYVGDRVMILGVEVGRITTIEPDGERVRVEFDYDNEYDVPADAKAAVVAPTLVTGRYIQLAPAYSGGPTLSDGDEIPLDRTAVPVEFDEIKKQVVKLSEDAGRTPEHPDGSLNRFVSSTAHTLDGTGTALHDSLTHLSDAATTLNASGEDLFGTVENLQKFSSALAASDQQIRAFSGELANVSGLLNANRTELDALLSSMLTTFQEVTKFVEDNRGALVENAGQLETITRLLVDRQDTLMSILHAGPTALSDFYNIYDPDANSLTGALAVPEMPDPRSLICALLTTVDAPANECATAAGAFAAPLANAAVQQATSAPVANPTPPAGAPGSHGPSDPVASITQSFQNLILPEGPR